MVMDLEDALQVVATNRGDQLVIPTMGAIGVWPKISDRPTDFHYMPSSMGQGPSLGLGLALAQPQRGVIVLCGDGSLLMNLGCLVTIAQYPAPLWLILLDNGHYEITGGQPVPGSGHTDYAAIASGAGIRRVFMFDSIDAWRAQAGEVLSGNGPVFVWLKVQPRPDQRTPAPPRPMNEQIQRLRQSLGLNSLLGQ